MPPIKVKDAILNSTISDIEFVRRQADSFGDRTKIYEKPDYTPQPPDYKGKLPWTVQQQIAATSGIQYADRVGKLTDHPTYALPVKKVDTGLLLVYPPYPPTYAKASVDKPTYAIASVDKPSYAAATEGKPRRSRRNIGTGWGRWLVAGAAKGYIPVGIDLRLEFCQSARQTLKSADKNGYVVVVDLKEILFTSPCLILLP